MILGLQHPGSGVGDMLFCYLAARITAERLGVPYAMVGEPKWLSFIKADFPRADVPFRVELPAGKIVIENDMPIYEGKTYYDPEFNFIEDNTIVDGCRCQDERYWEAYPIDAWLKTDSIPYYATSKGETGVMPDDLCIIGFRGGEYYAIPELGLTKDYFVDAMNEMRKINPDMRFRIVTDDPDLARTCFPHIEVTHDLAMDWLQVRHAKYAIIANSAFYILPRWMRHHSSLSWKEILNEEYTEENLKGPITIAPRRWARRNIPDAEWSTPQSYYPSFKYI